MTVNILHAKNPMDQICSGSVILEYKRSGEVAVANLSLSD